VKTKNLTTLILILLLASAFSSCSAIGGLLEEETPIAFTATPAPLPTSTPGTLGIDAPISLQLWVPPEFDPQSDSEAAQLLQERLAEYSRLHPGIRVVTRVKAGEGPASLLDTLSAAVSAAPLALPDLVLLSTHDARTAAERNLIYPLQTQIDFSTDNDWYGFVENLVAFQEESWGVPVAADVLVMVYRPYQTPEPPEDWATFFEQGQRLIFPAADPQALFTLLLYLSESQQTDILPGMIWDASSLESVLNFYKQAQASNLMPYWLTQLDSDQLVWEGFLDGQAELGITWASHYLQEAPETVSAGLIPTQDGSVFTLATGWIWAVATPNAERQNAAENLALYLSEADFSGRWTQAAGLLPVRPTALVQWENTPDRALTIRLLPEAIPAPGETVLSTIGPALQEAATGILKQEISVSAAVEAALNRLDTSAN
jgi:multiple sugar transport system substrate-binding protein